MEWIAFSIGIVVILLQVLLLVRTKVSSLSSFKESLEHLEQEQSRVIGTLRTELERWIQALKQELRDDFVRHSDSTRKSLQESKESSTNSFDKLSESVGKQLKAGQEVSEKSYGQQMQSFRNELETFKGSLLEQIKLLTTSQNEHAQGSEQRISGMQKLLDDRMAELARTTGEKMENLTTNSTKTAEETRNQLSQQVTQLVSTVVDTMKGMSDAQTAGFNSYSKHFNDLTTKNHSIVTELSNRIDQNLKSIREDSNNKLEQIKKTVDEQLQEGLQKRVNESFRLVNDRLEQVHKGLGEMQTLATGVGDLKQVLTNVKSRGTWGEVQLKTLLEQVLVPDQYIENASINGGRERVEFAVKLPGRGDNGSSPALLPIDAKFPLEDYQRLQEAQDAGDKSEIEQASKALKNRITECAKTISQKYIQPPHTTDFAILFLPFEGLFAEVVRQLGLCEELQTKHRILLAGPTTLWSLLNSLQLGFKTLAIQKRTSEVWSTLSEVKTEWNKYIKAVDLVEKKFAETSTSFSSLSTRTRVLGRKFENLELGAPVDEPEPSVPHLNVTDIAG